MSEEWKSCSTFSHKNYSKLLDDKNATIDQQRETIRALGEAIKDIHRIVENGSVSAVNFTDVELIANKALALIPKTEVDE